MSKQENINRALMESLRNQDLGQLKICLSRGAELKKVLPCGGGAATPMGFLARRACEGKISKDWALLATEVLIKAGAGVSVSALAWAAAGGNTQLFRLMISSKDSVLSLSRRTEVYCAAVRHGQVEMLRELQALHGRDLTSTVDSKSENIMAVACQAYPGEKQIRMVEYLLNEAGYTLDMTTTSVHKTALHLSNNSELTEFLITKGADIEAKSKGGKTPLFYAKSVEQINCLVRYGADIKTTDHQGRGAVWTMWSYGVDSHVLSHAVAIGVSHEGHLDKHWGNKPEDHYQETARIIKSAKTRDKLIEVAGKNKPRQAASKAPKI